MSFIGWWWMLVWCIIGTVVWMILFEVVMDVRVVHHWDGSLDGVASLWLSKEHVPADGTRALGVKRGRFF